MSMNSTPRHPPARTEMPRPAGTGAGVIRRLVLAVLFAALAVLVLRSTAAAAAAVSENKARALFLANFVKYVDWPAEALGASNAPVVIGLVGKCDLEDELKALAKTMVVAGRPLTVTRIEADTDIRGFHIIFIPAVEIKKMASLLNRPKGNNALTVSDDEKFVSAGGMIALLRRDSRIRPQVGLAAVERGGLKISSKLLAVSDVVHDAPAAGDH